MAARFFFAYQEFRGEEGLKLQRELSRIKGMHIPKEILMRNPLVRFGMSKGLSEGLRKGMRQGRRRGEAELVLRQLARRLGAISPAQENTVRKLSLAGIETLGEALLDFRSNSDLARWLKSHAS